MSPCRDLPLALLHHLLCPRLLRHRLLLQLYVLRLPLRLHVLQLHRLYCLVQTLRLHLLRGRSLHLPLLRVTCVACAAGLLLCIHHKAAL